MIKVALTGNIASGKSSVKKIIETSGFEVLDTDEIGHALLTKNNSELIEAFGIEKVFDDDGNFDRKKLGELVFNSPEKLKLLNSIIHPQIKKEIRKYFEQKKDCSFVFVEIPLLFEAGMENLFDKIIIVYAEDAIRVKRLIDRNGYTEDYAKKRMLSQIPQEEKFALVDYIIDNNGTEEELFNSTREVLEELFIEITLE